MPVLSIWTALGAILLVAALVRLTRVWLRYRGRRTIMCPENRRPAGVVLDAGHAAATGLGRAPDLRLACCTRWPERAGCGQECLAEIAAAPEDCLVRNILIRWYAGKVCSSCRKRFGDIDWKVQKPALLAKDGTSMEWDAVPADRLHEVLAVSLPICFACHMANTLVREHPDLAVKRSQTGPI